MFSILFGIEDEDRADIDDRPGRYACGSKDTSSCVYLSILELGMSCEQSCLWVCFEPGSELEIVAMPSGRHYRWNP